MQPVEMGDEFYGMIMAVNFQDNTHLQRTARYLSITLRNFHLENQGKGVEVDNDLELGVSKAQLPLALSREISRSFAEL